MNRVIRRALLLSIVVLSAGCGQAIDSPPASNAVPPASPVASGARLIFTYYFYWYDATTGGHLQQQAGIRYHLPPTPTPSWRSQAWQERQLADMAKAGIDVTLPDYWGFDTRSDDWSWKGLDVLAKAWHAQNDAGGNPPKIGMFLDTTVIRWRDLTVDSGKAYFYANFHDFFTRIPRDEWALIDGRPVAFLFTSDWTTAMNQSSFDYIYSHFQSDFGVRPYIVREVSWDYPILRWNNGQRVRDYQHPIKTENNYLWDAAAHGYIDRGGVAEVGPGYDDHLVPGRGNGTVTDRDKGAFYHRNFDAAIASGKSLLAVETWNEIHEGTGIGETVEFGRQYINLTHDLAAAFHRGKS
ncbi:MAG: DUF5010 domain-containing protein [Candidatus Dormibacteraeota bacterium]|nr:DUF5010 domain-containing protein [Candidatus Dormibacteraeota bacterium]